MQTQIEEEQRQREEARESYNMAERRCMMLQGEVEELRTALEQAERARKAAESELSEANERVNELSAQVSSFQGQKRKLESDIQAMQVCYQYRYFLSLSSIQCMNRVHSFNTTYTGTIL